MQELAFLHERVLQAGSRTTALNELSLRRISADLHGPAQVLALALLRLDALRSPCGDHADFRVMQESLSDVLQEVRAISSGPRRPELETVSVVDVLERAVGERELRSRTSVKPLIEHLPNVHR